MFECQTKLIILLILYKEMGQNKLRKHNGLQKSTKVTPAKFECTVYSLVCLRRVKFAIHYIVQRRPSLRKTCCSLLQCIMIMKGCKWANLQL